ncbi:MAG: alanine racemase, partial [Verrucomicrobiota bacterium]|nr:alanine racemase [Verrucomicrobiota bacterium]
MTMCNGSWVEIHVDRVCRNAQAIQHALGGTRLIAVVKSDAYGHGLGPVAEALGRAGVRDFAVAYSAEASVVRSAVPQAERILVLGTAFAEDLPRLLQDGITPMVVSLEQAVQLSDAAWAAGRKTLPVHIKLDTGMGRLGFICPAELDQAAEVLQLPGLHVEGLCTHFAMVEPKRRPEAAQQQAQRFQQAAAVLEEQAGRRLFRHISSSRAALLAPDFDQDGARVGISLYGYGSADPGQRFFSRPVLQWKSK